MRSSHLDLREALLPAAFTSLYVVSDFSTHEPSQTLTPSLASHTPRGKGEDDVHKGVDALGKQELAKILSETLKVRLPLWAAHCVIVLIAHLPSFRLHVRLRYSQPSSAVIGHSNIFSPPTPLFPPTDTAQARPPTLLPPSAAPSPTTTSVSPYGSMQTPSTAPRSAAPSTPTGPTGDHPIALPRPAISLSGA